MGRPSTYSEKVADAICERIANGEFLRAICRSEGMPPEATVRQWVVDDAGGFAARYARAREIGFDSLAEGLEEIASGKDGDEVQRDKLKSDNRKWLLSKWSKRYADKTVLAGDPDAPLQIAEIRRTVVDPK